MEYIKGANGYNLEEIRNAQAIIKKFNITVSKKSDHKNYFQHEVKKILDNEMVLINKWLFDSTSFYQYTEYKRKIELNDTKVNLDHAMIYCLESMYRELEKIVYECF